MEQFIKRVTSGLEESLTLISINLCIGYANLTKRLPHFVIHEDCSTALKTTFSNLYKHEMCHLTLIKDLNSYESIEPNTCAIILAAYNKYGASNNLTSILDFIAKTTPKIVCVIETNWILPTKHNAVDVIVSYLYTLPNISVVYMRKMLWDGYKMWDVIVSKTNKLEDKYKEIHTSMMEVNDKMYKKLNKLKIEVINGSKYQPFYVIKRSDAVKNDLSFVTINNDYVRLLLPNLS